jgi:hypothetical protein
MPFPYRTLIKKFPHAAVCLISTDKIEIFLSKTAFIIVLHVVPSKSKQGRFFQNNPLILDDRIIV